MAHYVKIAAVQFETRAQRSAPDARRIVLEETQRALDGLKGYGLDLAVFCEGVEGFAQTAENAEETARPGPLLSRYAEFARSERCHVAGSVKIREGGKAHNSIAFLGPEGSVLGVYHKVHLTHGEIEAGLTSGRHAVVVETPIGRLGGAICFDLNFEELRREYQPLKPDILAFASMYHGGLMQGAWAYGCRSFFVSALRFIGSGILDPFGRPLALTDCYTRVAMATVNLDRAMVHLDYNRERFPEIRKKYRDEVVVDIPPNIGSALIYSCTDKRSALDVVKEFELELLDDYFARARASNAANR